MTISPLVSFLVLIAGGSEKKQYVDDGLQLLNQNLSYS